MIVFSLKCAKHPRYAALRAPRADCYTCRGIWSVSPDNVAPSMTQMSLVVKRIEIVTEEVSQ